MKKSKNNNIILGFGYWVLEFGFSWCKGKVKCYQKIILGFGYWVFEFGFSWCKGKVKRLQNSKLYESHWSFTRPKLFHATKNKFHATKTFFRENTRVEVTKVKASKCRSPRGWKSVTRPKHEPEAGHCTVHCGQFC